MRKHYLDNLRWIAMLQLIVMHTCMAYNVSGLPFFFRQPGLIVMDAFTLWSEPWRQTVFFLIAGMNMRGSIEKHGTARFLFNRAARILLPFLFCKATLIPGQFYITARAYGTADQGLWSYLTTRFLPDYWRYYAGQDSQLWFLRVLLVNTVLVLLTLLIFNRGDRLWRSCARADIRVLLLLTVPVMLCGFLFRVGTYHFYGRYYIILLLGYLMLSHEEVLHVIDDNLALLTALSAVFLSYLIAALWGTNLYHIRSSFHEGLWYSSGWICSLACLGLFRRFANRTNRLCRYMTGAYYFIYLTHQNIIIRLVYALSLVRLPLLANYLIVISGTTLICLALYELVRRIPAVRYCLGIDTQKANPVPAVPAVMQAPAGGSSGGSL